MSMDPKTLLADMKSRFPDALVEYQSLREKRILMRIKKDALTAIAAFLFKDRGLRFIIASALDLEGGWEIIYHFSHDPSGLIVNLSVVLERDTPQVESLVSVFEGAEWIEREMYELFGIKFLHHPNLEKFLLPENWKAGQFPLRRDFPKERENS